MLTLEINRIPNIKIYLDGNGVYTFNNISGSGKTYLYNIIKKYRMFNEKMVGYSILEYKQGIDLDNLIKPTDIILMLDRYDLYRNNKFDKTIEEFSKHGAVLVDCKDIYNFNFDANICNINLNEGGIIVKS